MRNDDGSRPPLDQQRLVVPDGWAVEVLPEAGSTNALAAERARAGAPEGTVVVTEHQTAGRGRLDRTWTTPARSALTFSTVLRPDPVGVPPAAWPWLPLLTGVAVVRALGPAGVPAGLKWPNDVLVGDRKLAGLLVERVETPTGPAAVVGIGLNVSLTAEELPVPTATSAELVTGAPVDRTLLLGSLLAALAGEYAAWSAAPRGAGGAALRASYAAACTTVGRTVRVHLPGGDELVGEATGIDEGGRLEVAGPDGTVAVGAGDVVHVRPVV